MSLNEELALGLGETWREGTGGEVQVSNQNGRSEAARQGKGSIRNLPGGGHKERPGRVTEKGRSCSSHRQVCQTLLKVRG